MTSNDTVELLKECNSGIKMGVNTIDEVCDKVKDGDLRRMLDSCKEEHQRLGSRTHELLSQYHAETSEPGFAAKAMSWIKTNVMLPSDGSDSAVADLVTDGCNMGVKNLNKYLNRYESADSTAKNLAGELISLEEKLACDLRRYL